MGGSCKLTHVVELIEYLVIATTYQKVILVNDAFQVVKSLQIDKKLTSMDFIGELDQFLLVGLKGNTVRIFETAELINSTTTTTSTSGSGV